MYWRKLKLGSAILIIALGTATLTTATDTIGEIISILTLTWGCFYTADQITEAIKEQIQP